MLSHINQLSTFLVRHRQIIMMTLVILLILLSVGIAGADGGSSGGGICPDGCGGG